MTKEKEDDTDPTPAVAERKPYTAPAMLTYAPPRPLAGGRCTCCDMARAENDPEIVMTGGIGHVEIRGYSPGQRSVNLGLARLRMCRVCQAVFVDAKESAHG